MLGTELKGKQLGLVGMGRIGARGRRARARVRHARGLCVRTPSAGGEAAAWEHLSLDRLLNTSDVVSLHVPLTPTRGISSTSARSRA